MNIHDGRIGLSREELGEMRQRGFSVSQHTDHYMNGIVASFGDVTVGLYNWLDGLDAYVGDTQVLIKTEEQALRFLAVMDSLVELNRAIQPE